MTAITAGCAELVSQSVASLSSSFIMSPIKYYFSPTNVFKFVLVKMDSSLSDEVDDDILATHQTGPVAGGTT